jgi:hypothetical protein
MFKLTKVGAGSAGSIGVCLAAFLGVKLRLYFRVRNGYDLPHKIRELTKVAYIILGRLLRLHWDWQIASQI